MLTRDEIIWGYTYVLGRSPQPEEIARVALQPITKSKLREQLLNSDEFAAERKIIGHVSKWVITEIFDGRVEIWIDLADKYVSFGCLIDNYEPLETNAFRQLLRPGFHVADVGANVGWFSLLAALCIGQEGRVSAFEPRIPTVDYLRRSVHLNGFEDRIVVFQNAAGDCSETVPLSWHPMSRNPGSSHIGKARDDAEIQLVEMRKLDALLAGSKVDCIKMDIEGAEGLALAGAGALLQESRPFILCEINPTALNAVSGMTVDDFLRLVRARNYVLFLLGNGTGLTRLDGSLELGGRELINVVLAHEERLPESS
jgi:FkbM family methyltransferase